jgi:hypothetical protein
MRRLQIYSGSAFLFAWIVGLMLAASGPKQTDSATKIAGYFSAHEHKAMVAHLLIDGLAGIAIFGIAYSLRAFLSRHDAKLAKWMFLSGALAAVASLAQAVLGLTLTYRAAHGSSAHNVKTLFTALNDGDTVKIALLAGMIGLASLIARRANAFPRWLATGGLIFAPLLALSGLAFPLNSNAIYASLELTLLLLLAWVVAVTVVVAKRAPQTEAAPMPVTTG